jgi:hypothetical protein
MVSPEPSERLREADHSIRSRMLTQLREGIRSHPDTYLIGCDGTPAVCRICWGEEEEDDSEGKIETAFRRSHPWPLLSG